MHIIRVSNSFPDNLEQDFKQIKISMPGIQIMLPKFAFYVFRIVDLPAKAANILKQNMLSIGGEVAVPASVASFDPANVDVYLAATASQLLELINKLVKQPFGLLELSILLSKELRGDGWL